ncbi:hypothetical protein H5410_035152 [Solanum commersonii]|uniref:Uncharacterized protein n=1 Tax=Solanum commersonii TaxID=4109 RepID=A0A9J5Y2Z4_SOLCO|nr:hypothetical protein H5410_035152 [Solanum commersonii]
MESALETLCGQTYGATHHHMFGIHMQRGMYVSLLVNIPIACIWAHARSILVNLRHDPKIAVETRVYAWFMIPSIFAYGLLELVFHMLSEGLGGAKIVRVSNEPGARQPQSTCLATRTATLLATGEGTYSNSCTHDIDSLSMGLLLHQ